MSEYAFLLIGVAILIGVPFAIAGVAEWMEIDGLPAPPSYGDILDQAPDDQNTIRELSSGCGDREGFINQSRCVMLAIGSGSLWAPAPEELGSDDTLIDTEVDDLLGTSWISEIFAPITDITLTYAYGIDVLKHEKGFNLPGWFVTIFFGIWLIIVSLIIYEKIMGGLPFT